jgi:sec-independent protein translocase protein TatA
MGSFSITHWLILLVIVVLVFGTGKLKNLGRDLGGAIKGFKEGVREGETPPAPPANPQVGTTHAETPAIDVTAREKSSH